MPAIDSQELKGGDARLPCPACPAERCPVRRFSGHMHLGTGGTTVGAFEVPRGGEVRVPDDGANALRIVIDGMVMVEDVLPDGRRQVTGFRAPGDVLSLPSDNQTPRDVMTASVPTRICRLRVGREPRAAALRNAIGDLLFETACQRLLWAERHHLLLARLSARERVAGFLMDMAMRIGHRSGMAMMIDLPMNREAIADHLGLNSETVSRQFTDLKRRGAIALPRPGLVAVPDLGRLAAETPVARAKDHLGAASPGFTVVRSGTPSADGERIRDALP